MPPAVLADGHRPARWVASDRQVTGRDGSILAAVVYEPVVGDPQRPTLVCVHGWRCDGRTWHEQVARLAADHRIVVVDLPGHGRTPPPNSGRYSLDVLGDALTDTVAATVDADSPVVLAGHSLGGMTVLNALARSPTLAAATGGVVLVSSASRAVTGRLIDDPPSGIRRQGWPHLGTIGRSAQLIKAAEPSLHHRVAEQMVAAVTRQPTDLVRLLIRTMGLGPEATDTQVAFTEALLLEADPQLLLRLVTAIATLDVDAGLDVVRRQRIPATIVVGSQDRMTPPRASRRMAQLSGATLIELDGVGHFAPIEAPARVAAALADAADAAAAHRRRTEP